MEAYAAALTYAIPGFIALIVAEAIAARFMDRKINSDLDIISSLSSGVTNTLKSIVGLSVILVSYDWMVNKIGFYEWQSTWTMYFVAFVGIDFASYWSHRFNHEINVLWNRHFIHHSSEEFNLSCALRQPISNVLSIYFFLYIPLALIGVPAQVVAFLAPIHLFAQFWYHTRLIDKMGPLEYVLVTPSHHRVHHAINPEYIDRNYAAIFIVWDKLFGTFQEEMDDVPAVYGTKTPARTWNPVLINYLHLWQLIKDAWRTKSWKDKLRIWIKPTGWRPEDVAEKYPVETIDNVYSRNKYKGVELGLLKLWSWVQLVITNLILLFVLIHISDFTYFGLMGMALFLFFGIFAYTSLMDGHWSALVAEILKVLTATYFIVWTPESWHFQLGVINLYGIMIVYVLASFIISSWIYIRIKRQQQIDLVESTVAKT
jgi:sterol desaturase/sphingolipid hydroxylase (fatty acid hydroxylase superfamily)